MLFEGISIRVDRRRMWLHGWWYKHFEA